MAGQKGGDMGDGNHEDTKVRSATKDEKDFGIRRVWLWLGVGLMVAGCGASSQKKAAVRGDTLVKGEGKITQMNEALGSATLQTNKGPMKIWWRTEVNQPGHGSWKQWGRGFSGRDAAGEGGISWACGRSNRIPRRRELWGGFGDASVGEREGEVGKFE